MTTQTTDHAQQQAKAQLKSIREMMDTLNNLNLFRQEDEQAIEEAQQAIQDDPLAIQVRSGWRNIGDDHGDPEEFYILLCTGGPAVRILGDLGEHNEPENVALQYQDWGTPWTNYPMTQEETESVLDYCRQFPMDC